VRGRLRPRLGRALVVWGGLRTELRNYGNYGTPFLDAETQRTRGGAEDGGTTGFLKSSKNSFL